MFQLFHTILNRWKPCNLCSCHLIRSLDRIDETISLVHGQDCDNYGETALFDPQHNCYCA